MELLKSIIKIILGIALSIFISLSVTYCLTNDSVKYKTECGIVVSKSADEIVIKHGTQTELYLNIQFEKSGFKSIEVEPTLYFQKKKGDRVCFELVDSKNSHPVFWICGAVLGVLMCIIILILFFTWLFNINWDI